MTTARIIRSLGISLGLLVAATSLHALPIRFLAWDDAMAERKIGFMNGTDMTELQQLHPHKRSKVINWKPGEVPPALIALDRTSDDGKPVTIPLKFAAGLRSPLVLILPDPQHPTGMRSYVLEDAAGSFAWGTLRFINATGKEIMVRSEKTVKALPETWKTVDFKLDGGKRNIAIQMVLSTDLNTVLYSSVWEHDPDVRKLIIVVPGSSTDGGALDLKIIPEDRRSIAVAVEQPSSAQAQ